MNQDQLSLPSATLAISRAPRPYMDVQSLSSTSAQIPEKTTNQPTQQKENKPPKPPQINICVMLETAYAKL